MKTTIVVGCIIDIIHRATARQHMATTAIRTHHVSGKPSRHEKDGEITLFQSKSTYTVMGTWEGLHKIMINHKDDWPIVVSSYAIQCDNSHLKPN